MPIDWSFIKKMEGSSYDGYVPAPDKSQSGVTIGSGVDLGQRTSHEIDALNISADLKMRLKPYAGLKKYEAVNFLKDHPLHLSEEEAEALNQAVREPLVRNLIRLYDDALPKDGNATLFQALPDQIQTAIASVAFQYGINLKKRAPRFWALIIAQKWDACIAELEHFGDAYGTRRRAEAALIRAAMHAST